MPNPYYPTYCQAVFVPHPTPKLTRFSPPATAISVGATKNSCFPHTPANKNPRFCRKHLAVCWDNIVFFIELRGRLLVLRVGRRVTPNQLRFCENLISRTGQTGLLIRAGGPKDNTRINANRIHADLGTYRIFSFGRFALNTSGWIFRSFGARWM